MGISGVGTSVGTSVGTGISDRVGDGCGCGNRCGNSVDIGGNSAFNMNVRNLGINVGLRGNFLMNVCDSLDILMNVRDSLNILMNVFLSSDILMNIGYGSRVNLSGVVIRVYNNGSGMDNRGRGSGSIVSVS